METIDGISLSVGGAAVGTICTCLVQMWKARHQKTEITPNPLSIEQTSYQASQKQNASDHANIFGRISGLEQRVSAVEAKADAKFESIKDQLTDTNNMVRQLVERICKGRK